MKLAKSKSFHLVEKDRPLQLRLVGSQGKFSRPKVSRPARRAKKIVRVKKDKGGRELTNQDVDHLESSLLCKRRFNLKLPLSTFDEDVKRAGARTLGAVDCVKRIKKEKRRSYVIISFRSKRQITEFRLYKSEADILENTKDFEETLHATRADEDIDTDDEQIAKAYRIVVDNLLTALKKYPKQDKKNDQPAPTEKKPVAKQEEPKAGEEYSFSDSELTSTVN